AARRTQCKNNLKQIGLALHTYHDTYNVFPPLGLYGSAAGGSWSAHARILPFLEQANLQNLIDWGQPYGSQPDVTRVRVPIYLCPSDPNDRERPDGAVTHYPVTYGFVAGTWLIWDPVNRRFGDGAFVPNQPHRAAQTTDGLSNPVGASEVKAWQAYLRDG